MSNPLTRLRVAEVEDLIASTTYMRTPSGKTILCEIMLTSGYSCVGLANVVDLDNDDEARGKEAAHAKALAEVWSYAAIIMQDRMASGAVENRNLHLLQEYTAAHSGQPRLI